MNFRPLHDRVVIRRVTAEEKTSGGIIIPDTAQEKPMQGEVISVGPGARNENGEIVALDVKAGDRILFGKWSGTEVRLDGEELLIMKESDIMGIIEGQSTGAVCRQGNRLNALCGAADDLLQVAQVPARLLSSVLEARNGSGLHKQVERGVFDQCHVGRPMRAA